MLVKARWAETNGYDAIVVNCMVDPGLVDLRRAVSIPVIGAGRAAFALASVLGDRPMSIFPGRIRVNALAENEAHTLEELTSIGRRCVATRGADAITLGCSYLGGAAGHVQDKIGVPVIATIEVALKLAELIACLGIRPQQPCVEGNRLHPLVQLVYRTKDRLFGLAGRLRQWLRRRR
jgi:allantoin racemase